MTDRVAIARNGTLWQTVFECQGCCLAVPRAVQEAIQKRIEHPIYGYTRWNHEGFKDSVALWYSKRFHTTIDKKSIVYSPSVMYSASQLIDMLSSPEEGVVVQTPGYDGFFKVI